METRVNVRGIRELSSAFRKVDAELPRALKVEFLAIAEAVASVARGKTPKRTGRAAASIKSRGSTRGGSIAFGGTAAPYMPWLNFGGRVGPNRRIFRARVEPDRYIYTAIAEKHDDTAKAVDDAVERVAKSAGFETHG